MVNMSSNLINLLGGEQLFAPPAITALIRNFTALATLPVSAVLVWPRWVAFSLA